MKWFAVLFVLASCRCSPAPAPTPPPQPLPPNDGLGTPIGDACANLRKLQCSEGNMNAAHHTCYEVLSAANVILLVSSACLASAATVDVVRGCGDANSVRVRCTP